MQKKTYKVVDENGEIQDINLIKHDAGGIFEKVFIDELASMIECTGPGTQQVLSWIIKNKNKKNEIFGTQRGIAQEAKVSLTTVAKVIKALKANNYIKTHRHGVYLINPKVMHFGSNTNRMAILKIWNDLK